MKDMVDISQQQTTNNIDLPMRNSDDSNDLWQEFDIDFKRSSKSPFGFSIIGGYEDSPAIRISYIEKGGAADCDGRLKLHDIILQVNKISFKDINHQKAVRELRSSGKHIRMRIRRFVPRTIEEMPSYLQNNYSRLSISGTLRNVTIPSNDSNNQPQQSPQMIPCTTEKPLKQRRSSENRSFTISRTVEEYEVGTYEDLKRRLLRRIDLNIHHLIPPDIASTIIPEYKESEAIAIALNSSKFHLTLPMFPDQIDSLLSNNSPKKILADGIVYNREPRTIPSPVLLEAIQLHCQKFPLIYRKAMLTLLRREFSTIPCNGNKLALQIPLIYPTFLGTVPDMMKYGNRVKSLPVKVRWFLEETGTRELSSWESGDLSGRYIAHQDTNPLTGRPRFLTVHIRFNDSEKRKEESDKYITTITTYFHNIALSYK